MFYPAGASMLTLGISEQRRELRFGVGSGFRAGRDLLEGGAAFELSYTCDGLKREPMLKLR